MKTYQIKFTAQIIEGDDSLYNPKKVIDLSIAEKLPQNVDAHKYFRSRVAEELTRNFGNVADPIDNRTEESIENDDPLHEVI